MQLSGRASGNSFKLYTYDDFNRLRQYNDGATEAKYAYNASNLRTSKTVNRKKTDFVWNGQNLASETTNDVTTVYDYDLTGIIASTVNGEVTKYVKDPHGNVVVTSRNGSIAGEYDYSAFGEQLTATDTTNPFRYCGEYYDNENGLTYLRNRYYDSNTGRFLSEDPIKDGMNWYSYCGGDPIMNVDPSGLLEQYDYQFAPDVVAQLALYSFQYMAGVETGELHLCNEAANNATWLRNNSGRNYTHGQLKRLTNIYTNRHGEYNGYAVINSFMLSLSQIQSESSAFSSDALGTILGGVAGNMGEIFANFYDDGTDNVATEYADFLDAIRYYRDLQNQYGGSIDMNIKYRNYMGYLEVTFESYDGYIYAKEEFFKNTYEMIIFSAGL